MATYTEDYVYNLQVNNNGTIEVTRLDRVLKDGVVISSIPNRHIVNPGDDLTKEIESVKLVANTLWTPEVIAAYKATLPTTIDR